MKNIIYLHAKDPYEEKYQFLINKRKSTELRHLNDPKAFTQMIFKMFIKILKNTIGKKCKILIAFDDMIANMNN